MVLSGSSGYFGVDWIADFGLPIGDFTLRKPCVPAPCGENGIQTSPRRHKGAKACCQSQIGNRKSAIGNKSRCSAL